MQDEKKKFNIMTRSPVRKLVCKLAIPTIISMIVTAVYNAVDTVFVGQIDTSATAAVGIAFSFMALIQAVGFLFGHGSGNPISRELGQKNTQEASCYAALGFFSSFFFGLVIMAVGLIFTKPLCILLGATEDSLSYTMSYIGIISIGAPFMTSSFTLNNQLRLEGNAAYAMIGIASGAVLNVVLDPIFIFVCNMGVAGAALATIISQILGFCILGVGIYFKGVRIKFKYFRPTFARYRKIINCGIPSFFRQGFNCIATICLNNVAGNYGDVAIAAFSIVTRITNFAYSAILGFGQGFQPVCGWNYGAKKYDRVCDAFSFCVSVATIVCIIFCVVGGHFSYGLVAIFRDDPLVIDLGGQILSWQCFTFPTLGLITMSNMLLQNLGKGFWSSVLAVARQGLFFLPLLYLLNFTAGQNGLLLVQSIADLLTFAVSLPITYFVIKDLKSKKSE